MTTAAITRILPHPAVPRDGWTSVATHSHMLRSHDTDFEGAKHNLVAWARANHIGAVGVGSPWEPLSARHYKHYEQVERDAYFGGLVDPATVMDREAVAELISDLNTLSNGDTLFYLDNETPKNRHGHLWFVGFDYQVPAWHDYSQDHRTQFWDGDPCEDPNRLTGGCHLRRSYGEVVARQRNAGALAVWAHPTSWWMHEGAFITNIAAEMVLHLLADGFLDGMVVQGYDACHRAYQSLWFDLLDRGARVPGFAELDACYDSATIAAAGLFLNHLPCPARLPELIHGLRATHHYASSGPHLVLEVGGHPTGSCLPAGNHRGRLTALPAPGENVLSRVELIGRGGSVLALATNFTGGTIEFDVAGDGYLLARAFGEHDDHAADRHQSIRHCALTNPVYFGATDFQPVRTQLEVTATTATPFTLLDAAGAPLESGTLHGTTFFDVNPLWRLRVEQPGRPVRDIPIAMANAELRRHIDYLADGHFRDANPGIPDGDIPVEAFRFDEIKTALARQTLIL